MRADFAPQAQGAGLWRIWKMWSIVCPRRYARLHLPCPPRDLRGPTKEMRITECASAPLPMIVFNAPLRHTLCHGRRVDCVLWTRNSRFDLFVWARPKVSEINTMGCIFDKHHQARLPDFVEFLCLRREPRNATAQFSTDKI